MESLNVKNINDEKIFNVIDPNGQGEVVNRIRPISISINQKAETINDETDSTVNLSVYWNDTWKSILDLTFNDSLRQEYGKLVTDLTAIQKDIDMKQYKDAETKTADFLKYVANLSSKYTAIPETQNVAASKNEFISIIAEKSNFKVKISDKLLNFMLRKFAKVDNLDYTKANECHSINRHSCIENDIDMYFHSPELFQKQAYMTIVKDHKVVGSYKVNYDQFCKLASKFDITPQKLGYSRDRLAGYIKTAEVVMQNIFFDSVDEAKEWQEMVDEKKKEKAEAPEGEEETTETTKTETTMEEGKSESPVKGDGGLARPSEDFASDEIPESEPRQQEQQGGGQNLGASKRVNLLKKKASYTDKEISNIGYEQGAKDGTKAKGIKETQETINKNLNQLKENYGKDKNDMGSFILKEWNSFVTGYTNGFSDGLTGNVEKKAKVGYNAEPENMEEEVAIELADELMSAANVALEKAGLLLGGYSGEEQRRQRVDVQKNAIEPLLKGRLKESIQGKVIDLIKEHLTDLNYHTLVSAIEEVMDSKQASKKVKLNKKAEDITEIEENYKESGFNIKYKNLVIKDNAFVQEELKTETTRVKVEFVVYGYNIPNGMAEANFNCVVKPSKANATIPHIENYTISYDVVLDDETKKQLDSILYNLSNKKIQSFCKYNDKGYLVYKYQVAANKKVELNKQARTVDSKQDIKQILKDKNAVEARNYGDFVSAIRENKTPVETIKAYGKKKTAGGYDEYVLVVYEGGAYFYTELSTGKRVDEKYYKFENVAKKALYGDVQEQDIVPAKTETKVYLQSEDKGNKKQLPNFSVTVRRNSDDEVVDIIECNTEKEAEETYKYMLSDLDKDCYVSINKLVGKEQYEEIKNSSLNKEESCKKANKNKLVNKQSEKSEDFAWLLNGSGRIEILAPKDLILGATGSGDNSNGVNELRDYIKKDLEKIPTEEIQKTVAEYGTDNVKEMDRDELERYLVWLLAGDTADDLENRLADKEDIKNVKAKATPKINKSAGRYKDKVAEMLDEIGDPTPLITYISESDAKEICEELDIPHEATWYKGDLSGYMEENPYIIDTLMEYISESDAKALWSQINIDASKKLNVQKKAEENIEEKMEQQVGEDGDVKGVIGVGDIVCIKFDSLSEGDFAKYSEFLGMPMLLIENDKEDINKVIIEQVEYPFQRVTINKDNIGLFDNIKEEQVLVEDVDGDEMITTFEELPVVAKNCKIKSIHKAAKISKKKASINSQEELAVLIDDVLSDYDWYDYADQLEVGEKSHYENILADLQKDEKGTIESLFARLKEDDEDFQSDKVEQIKEYYNHKYANGGK